MLKAEKEEKPVREKFIEQCWGKNGTFYVRSLYLLCSTFIFPPFCVQQWEWNGIWWRRVHIFHKELYWKWNERLMLEVGRFVDLEKMTHLQMK